MMRCRQVAFFSQATSTTTEQLPHKRRRLQSIINNQSSNSRSLTSRYFSSSDISNANCKRFSTRSGGSTHSNYGCCYYKQCVSATSRRRQPSPIRNLLIPFLSTSSSSSSLSENKTFQETILASQRYSTQASMRVLGRRRQVRNFSSLADATTRTRNTGDTDETLIQWQLQRLVIEGTIEDDYHQRRAAVELDRLRNDLLAQSPVQIASSSRSGEEKAKIESSAGSLFSSWLGGIFKKDEESTVGENPINAPKGAYLYGGPGCGKTFLMNRFYDAVDTGPWASDKQKVHYHKFMLSVHQQMHEARQQKKDGDPNDILPPVIDRIAKGGRLLCLDEFQVTDVADALILRRLFMGLWDRGCVLVATSNRPPEDLYLHGLQRDRFLPLIAEIGQRCVIINMSGSETDYRMMLSANESRKVYFYNKEERPEFDKLFHTISKGGGVRPTTLETQGRKVKIPMASETKRVCRFTFDDLCKKALGAADYLVIGQQYHTVFVDGIPKMTVNELNWLRRFITFVDTMYELRVTVIIWNYPSSIYEIFQVDNKEDYTQDEVFAFDRTLSRLEEMASQPYLQSQWLGASTPRGKIRNSLFLVPSQ